MKEEQLTTALSNLLADRQTLKALPIDPETKLPIFKIKIGDVEYTDRKEAAKALEEAALSIRIADTSVKVGEFQGFPLSITVHSPAMGGGMTTTMKGEYTHTAKLISSFAHNLNRIEAGLYNIDRRIDQVKMNAYEIMEHLLNLKEPKVYKTIEVPDGLGDTKERRVIDEEATRVVQKKAKEIKKAFKAWIFKDSERREAIVEKYNELFNSVRPREFDGSSLSFPMMNSSIHLHDHQKNAIAHAICYVCNSSRKNTSFICKIWIKGY